MSQYLTLRKCAYIFDASNSTYFYGTREQYAIKAATNKALKEYYESETKRAEKIPYTLSTHGSPVITIAGHPHTLNALQIAAIDGDPENVINHRRTITAEEVAKTAPNFRESCGCTLYHNKLKSFWVDFYTGADDLGYIRFHFKGWHEQIIIDDRTGGLFTSGEYGQHKPITAAALADCLSLGSKTARDAFNEIINAITK